MPAALAREEQELEKVHPETGVLSRHSRHAAHSSAHASAPPLRRSPRRHSHTESAERNAKHDAEHAPHNAREFLDAVREDAHPDVVPATRRRIRRAHRDFRLSLPVVIAGIALFGQPLWLIYVKSMASSASHQTNKLDAKIAQMQDDIARAQKKISAATSTTQLEKWSKQPGMNLRLATQADIDLVSPETKPRDATNSLANSAANINITADAGGGQSTQ